MTTKKKTVKKAVKATPVAKKSAALKMYKPNPLEVLTKIKVDDECFSPTPVNGQSFSVNVYANINSKDTNHKITLPSRAVAVIDCGFEMTVPAGYQAVLKASESYANKGLVITNGCIEGSKRVRVNVINMGREILFIENKHVFAEMTLRNTFSFKWEFE